MIEQDHSTAGSSSHSSETFQQKRERLLRLVSENTQSILSLLPKENNIAKETYDRVSHLEQSLQKLSSSYSPEQHSTEPLSTEPHVILQYSSDRLKSYLQSRSSSPQALTHTSASAAPPSPTHPPVVSHLSSTTPKTQPTTINSQTSTMQTTQHSDAPAAEQSAEQLQTVVKIIFTFIFRDVVWNLIKKLTKVSLATVKHAQKRIAELQAEASRKGARTKTASTKRVPSTDDKQSNPTPETSGKGSTEKPKKKQTKQSASKSSKHTSSNRRHKNKALSKQEKMEMKRKTKITMFFVGLSVVFLVLLVYDLIR